MSKKKKKETAPAFSGETMTPELPKEVNVDHVPTEKEELPLKDEVLVEKEDLPQVDKIEINVEDDEFKKEEAGQIIEDKTFNPSDHFSEPSIYDEDIEVIHAKPTTPADDVSKQWVANPALLRKVEGYRDTLSGTLYLGILK